MRQFTLDELAQYDGKGAARAYIAFGGKVYDVGGSFLWRRGRHWALHAAGQDLTESLHAAPHGEDLLERVPVIGILISDE